MRRSIIRAKVLIYLLAVLATQVQAGDGARYEVEKSWELGKVVADFPVGFCLMTEGQHQYVAYYDDQRRMTVAMRSLGSDEWTQQVLPSQIGWDSHNYVTMAVDRAGQLHVSGNMHAVPLVYFRTEVPGDIATLKRAEMTGEREGRVTYPKFLNDRNGRLVFNYRDGGSGRGTRIYNQYDVASQSWSRFLDQPLLDGERKRNAYPHGPVKGPDGRYHMVWVWRDTPDCATNHHLSYARSEDLKHWESAAGVPAKLPLTLDQAQLWVDPIPSRGGLINGGFRLTFDQGRRPVIGYHKSDEAGNMQLYVARAEGATWMRRQLTAWDKPVSFTGNGSMGFVGIRIGAWKRVNDGVMAMSYRHQDYGSGVVQVNENTLDLVRQPIPVPREFPQSLERVSSDFEGMQVRRSFDAGSTGNGDVRYMLQWETLGVNRDKPRLSGQLPGSSVLMLHKLRESARVARNMASPGIDQATANDRRVAAGKASRWYRGNTHTHTVICGHADSTPEVVTAWYHDHGYQFLILSEHNHFIDPATVELPANMRDDFILIPGVEVSGPKHIHSTAMNVREVVPWQIQDNDKSVIIQHMVDGTIAAGGEPILNHPNFWYAVTAEHMQAVENLHMFELFNGHPTVHNHGDHKHPSTEQMWDQMLTQGMRVYGVSSDDAHHFQQLAPDQSNPGRGWVMVQAEALDPATITAAMQRGEFYASNGVFLSTCHRGGDRYEVEVDVRRTENELGTLSDLRGKHVAEGQEGYRVQFIGPHGKVLREVEGTKASYRIESSAAYVRAKVILTRKHLEKGFEEYYAWGQPVFTDGRGR